ncbi:ABC transporter permease [Peptoclostridium litorale]|uniref:ABC transporter permease n=1 Tax=Peptoclostridium litorale TaxID=1557 RepID=UPI000570D719|nr:ABC transporter permease subunit [Peptoclostridium litorale]
MKRTGIEISVRIMLIFFAAMGAIPVIVLVLASISSGWSWPDVIPQKFSPRAWKYIFSSESIFAIVTTVKISAAVIFIDLILALPAANALGRHRFRFKRVTSALLMAPIIMPPLAITMGLHKTFIRMGLTENIWGVVAASIFPTLPYMIRALAVGYENIGPSWGEQAKMLGAGAFSRFCHVTFPLLLPAIVAGSSIVLLVSMSQYIIVLLIGGGTVKSLTVVMFPYISGGDAAIGSAYSIIFAAVSLALLFLMDIFIKRHYEIRKIY